MTKAAESDINHFRQAGEAPVEVSNERIEAGVAAYREACRYSDDAYPLGAGEVRDMVKQIYLAMA